MSAQDDAGGEVAVVMCLASQPISSSSSSSDNNKIYGRSAISSSCLANANLIGKCLDMLQIARLM
jgi:hypothetical protein